MVAAVLGAGGETLWRSASSAGHDVVFPPAGAPGVPVFGERGVADGAPYQTNVGRRSAFLKQVVDHACDIAIAGDSNQ